MKLNRRSVLGAIGTIGIGTGAAFGSGAFTSTTAQRAVEVSVFGANAGDEGDDTLVQNPNDAEEEDIATAITESSVDVLVDASSPTVAVRGGSDDSYLTPSNLFPTNATTYGVTNSSDYVSLVANDVTIVFGGNPDGDGGSGAGGLPPNSTVGYSGLFAFATGGTGTFDITFGSSDSPGEILTKVNSEDVLSGATVSAVGDNGPSEVDGTVDTTEATGSSPADERLDIVIETASS